MTKALYGDNLAVRLTNDGLEPWADIDQQDLECCADPLCRPVTETACSFVELLPSGPMWDKEKSDVQQIVNAFGLPPVVDDPFPCMSMAVYAAYMGQVLDHNIKTILQSYVREMNPLTARDSIDDWLERYGWIDCYRNSCRALFFSEFSPYERMTEIDDCERFEYCPHEYSPEFEAALKHAILRSLVRASRGVIRSLAGINWIIEPLGAQLILSDIAELHPDLQDYILNGSAEECGGEPCFCDMVSLDIIGVGDTLPGAPGELCDPPPLDVPALQEYICDNEPAVMLRPGVIAAECIVRSLLPYRCPNIIHRT